MRKVSHQESRDSGMPSEPDPAAFENHTVESHRLRHSRSWPDTLNNNAPNKRTAHSKSPSLYECRNNSALGAEGGGPSLELIASSHSDIDTEELLNRSAQEFTFNIPRNTSLDHPASCPLEHHLANIPSIHVTDELMEEGSDIMNTSNHVAYITDTLNSIFMTDPTEAVEVTCNPIDHSCNLADGNGTSSDNTGDVLISTPCELCRRYQAMNTSRSLQSTHHSSNEICDNCTPMNSAQTSTSVTDNNSYNQSTSIQTNQSTSIISTDNPVSQRKCHTPGCSCMQPVGSQGNQGQGNNLAIPTEHRVRYRRMTSTERQSKKMLTDKDSLSSTDSLSLTSDMREDSEITMAIQAAEIAARREARARFKSSGELIHRLFVCISGVADQLQTNYAADLRHILKCVFECNASEATADDLGICSEKSSTDSFVHIQGPENPMEESPENEGESDVQHNTEGPEPPTWVPDEEAPSCTACKAVFTFVRRRHHCRNCGNVFCGRCSSNSVPLPQFGQERPVRVCNRCFVFHVTPFTNSDE